MSERALDVERWADKNPVKTSGLLMRRKKLLYGIIIPFLLAGLLYIVFSYINSLSNSTSVSTDSNAIADTDQPLELWSFLKIGGTNYLWAKAATPRTWDYGYSSGEYQAGQIHNIIFLDSETLSSRRLFETNTMVILDTVEYPQIGTKTDDSFPVSQSEGAVTQWLVYQVVKEDTNGDGKKDENDLRFVSVSDVNGTNYAELLRDISGFNSMTMMAEGQLIVIYMQGDVYKASIFDLENRVVLSTEEIVEPGKISKGE